MSDAGLIPSESKDENRMDREKFKKRTKRLGLRVIGMMQALPNDVASGVIGKQILRSGPSGGANYWAACQGKSKADLSNKLKIVEEEADETLYWLEVLVEAEIVPESCLADLM